MQFIFGWTGVTRKTSSLGVWTAALCRNRLLNRELKSANKLGGPWFLNHIAFTTLTHCWRQLRYTFLDGLLISQIFRQSDLDFWKELQSLGNEIKTKNPWLHPSNCAVKSGGKKNHKSSTFNNSIRLLPCTQYNANRKISNSLVFLLLFFWKGLFVPATQINKRTSLIYWVFSKWFWKFIASTLLSVGSTSVRNCLFKELKCKVCYPEIAGWEWLSGCPCLFRAFFAFPF